MATFGDILSTHDFSAEDELARNVPRLIHRSDEMRDTAGLIIKVAPSSASVLIVGESGTGKELTARTLHELSDRRAGPFVAVDCGAIPETLIEGELFGHEKGAYTGASTRQPGRFELARGGSLFLDELVSMPLASQAKLLRALEERSFRRLGGKDELDLDSRIIAAVNEDPQQAIAEGRLREDLYYRVNVITITLPPLRDRTQDIPALANKFIQEFNDANGRTVRTIDEHAVRALGDYSWPGNVRELKNVIERAVILTETNRISLQDLPSRVIAGPSAKPRSTRMCREIPSGPEQSRRDRPWVGMTLDEATRRLLLDSLDAAGYNKTQAANMLGVSTKTVYNKLKEWSTNGDAEARLAETRCHARGSRVPRSATRVVQLDSMRAPDATAAES